MEKQVLSIKQMQELMELGIDTSKASIFWEHKEFGVYEVSTSPYAYNNPKPTFTLQDILILLEPYHRLMVIRHEPNEWMDSAFELLKFQYKDRNNLE